MAASELLRLIVQADTAGAVKGLENVGVAADKGLGKAEARADRLAGNLKKFGAVAFSAGSVAAAGLYKAGEAASDLEETVTQSEQIFGEAASGIGDFAKGAASSLGQSERAAREAANTFGLFFTNAGKSKDEAAAMSVELTKLASDMASFKNTTPEEAVEALGAALRGESEPIRRYGVMLDDATLKQRALDMGLVETTTGTLPPAIKMQAAYAEILEQTTTIQGDFERTSGGLANQQRILAAEFENAKAALGQGVLPILTKLTGVAADVTGKVAALDQATGGAVGTFATFATGTLLVGGGLSMAIGQLIQMRTNLAKLKGPLTNAEGGLNRLGKAGALAGIAAGLYGLGQMTRAMTEQKITAQEAMEATEGFTEALSEQDQAGLRALDGMGKLEPLFNDVAASSLEAAERMLEQAEAAGVSSDTIDRLRESLDKKRATEVQAARDSQDHAAAMAEAVPPAEDFAGAQESAADKVERLKDELEEATEAISDNYSAMHEATGLAIDYEQAIDDLIEGLKENGTSLDLTTQKGRDNMQQLIEMGDTIAGLIQKRYEETESVDAARDAGILYVENLKNQLREAGYTEDAIAELIAQMKLTPQHIQTNILADTSQATRAIDDYNAKLASVQRTVTTSVRGTWDLLMGRGISRNANGTEFFGGGLTWVGERGPEIVELPRGSKVHDAPSSARMASGGASTIVIPVSIGDREIDRLVVDVNKRTVRRGYAA